MYLTEVEVHRWPQSYLNTPRCELNVIKNKSYMYSGFNTETNNNLLPPQFQLYYDYFKAQNRGYNQVIANWYENEKDYISYHGDCEIGMIPNAEISIVSLYGINNDCESNYRTFSIIPCNDYYNVR